MASDPTSPGLTLLAKLGSIVIHADEATGDNSHAFDAIAMRGLIDDPEVQQWLKDMGPFIPQKR